MPLKFMMPLSTKIYQLFPSCNPQIPVQDQLWRLTRDRGPTKYFFSKYPGIIGLEVEAEKVQKPLHNDYWFSTHDHSLKDHGCEFLSKPIQGKNIDVALHDLKEHLTKWNTIDFSHRCSIHTHLNVSNNTIGEVFNFFNLLLLLEPYFFNFVEPHRRHNNFCVPITDVPLKPQYLLQSAKDSKYLSVAFNHLKDFGTLEFRSLEGTRDIVKIRRWIMLIQKAYLYALKTKNISVDSPEEIEVLAKKTFNTLFSKLNTPEYQNLDKAYNAFLSFSSQIKGL